MLKNRFHPEVIIGNLGEAYVLISQGKWWM